ncbi:MAG: terminase small subunit [Ruminococcus sp.]|nr:terminase small subunit [Ruminococcus sp.]
MPDTSTHSDAMKEKRRLFACNYVCLGSVREAALQSGFPPQDALTQGMRLLCEPACKKLIDKLRQSCCIGSPEIMSGFNRLAFGSPNDAVYLVFSDELPPADIISKLDLFNVSEIKRLKGGGVEVKLFDRQKALEKMLDCLCSADNSSSAASLLNALTQPQSSELICDEN